MQIEVLPLRQGIGVDVVEEVLTEVDESVYMSLMVASVTSQRPARLRVSREKDEGPSQMHLSGPAMRCWPLSCSACSPAGCSLTRNHVRGNLRLGGSPFGQG